MNKIIAIAVKYNLKIIEDAAELFGSNYKGKPIGSFGDISCVSFYANKHITTGEGGMILTDDLKLAERCRSLKNLCFIPEKRFYHEELGFNYRMTNLQAAVGVAQLERMDFFLEKKKKMGKIYNELLFDLKDSLELPLEKTNYAENIYWVYGLVLRDHLPFNADEMIKKLAREGIGARSFFWCIHEQPAFLKTGLFSQEKYPVSERMARKGFYIPSGLALTEKEMKIVSNKLHKLLQ
jgi:perosamine synthetase